MQKALKVMTGTFWTAVAGIALCFVMTVVTAVKEHREKTTPQPLSIPTPALPQ